MRRDDPTELQERTVEPAGLGSIDVLTDERDDDERRAELAAAEARRIPLGFAPPDDRGNPRIQIRPERSYTPTET